MPAPAVVGHRRLVLPDGSTEISAIRVDGSEVVTETIPAPPLAEAEEPADEGA